MSYAELHCKTNFSFLEGASHADELLARAAELGYAALAVTDRNTLAGVVRAHGAAKEWGVSLLVGAELQLRDAPPVVVWAADRASYGRLARLLTVGRRRAPKGECWLTWEDLAGYAAGLLAGLPLRSLATWSRRALASACVSQSASERASSHVRGGEWREWCGRYRELFGDRGYLLAELFRGPADVQRLAEWQAWSRESGVPLVAAGDVHYHVPARLPLADLLTAIRLGTTVDAAQGQLFANAQRHLRPLAELREMFAAAPGAVERTREVAERCRFQLDELRYEYPEELAPPGQTPASYLRALTWEGAERRYPQGVPPAVRQLLEHELMLIEELRYEAFFLTVWDLVRFARSRGILCQGRGSAANSAVCYCLEITSVDPARADVLFERFVSRERNEAPDIDVDFEHERREEVLQYLYAKYGRERAGLAAVVITYCARSAVRDVGQALGLSPDRVDALARQVEGYTREERLAERCAQVGLAPDSPLGQRLIHCVNDIIGFPRHLSQHVGGMVMTRGPLCELVPIENAAMEGRTVIQWDKDDLDELGILKVDCLCLGMLTAIRKCLGSIEQTTGRRWSLAELPPEDPAVYEMISRADTMGVFQIESRAQMSMLPRLRPRCFYDLVIEVAIVRPGPIQGQMVHPYLRRRNGEEVPEYPSEAIRQVLHKTLGVPLFQEQAMRLAVVAAGFTPGEADQLRRAMGAWRRPGVIDRFRRQLLAGMEARGLSRQFAEQVFQQIRGFGEYGFPESHAASFALLVYASAWLKHYYPAAFLAALLNSQPLGFYAPAQLVRDAREHGVRVRPVDVNASAWDCTLELPPDSEQPSGTSAAAPAVRLGFRLLQGLPRRAIERLLAARQDGAFRSVGDVERRAGLAAPLLARLAEADVFRSLEVDRRAALWQALGRDRRPVDRPLLAGIVAEEEELPVELPELPLVEQVLADYRTTGLSLQGHPLSFFRSLLASRKVVPARSLAELPPDSSVRVAGLVLLRQRPATAKGITFVTLEDETGIANLVIRQAIWERFYTVARRSPAWIAQGQLERHQAVIHVVVSQIEDLATQLRAGSPAAGGDWPVASRDFR
ncbi:MAG: error-prone DNA polymerase [Pirellulales bacterium]